ncbi:MAG: M48 family metallopeptidase [Bacteroidetes bacterium]|nr:M48 family metallopeptidase [Bacteroidota bacterium]
MLSLFENLFPAVSSKEQDPPIQQNFELEVNGDAVPVRILFEPRFNNRASVNKNGIIIRIAGRQSKEEQRKHIDNLLKWAKEKLNDKPELLENLQQRRYVNGEILKVGQYDFSISIHYHDLPKSSARIFKNNIVLSLSKGLSKEVEESTCSYLVSKCLCKFFLPSVTERIHELNERFFKKQVNSVKLKYASSFWGHCSHSGNIVISVRLMFAPPAVIDYVYIHELAHLVHHDHSAAFWKLVEQMMPDYRKAEKHLKENGGKYYL